MAAKSADKKQSIIIIVAAFAVIMLSVLTTVVISRQTLNMSAKNGTQYKNITFTDASLSCKNALEDQYGDDMQQMYVDDHSSRLDNDIGLYKIFMRATVRVPSKKNKELAEFSARCYVRTRNGVIAEFETFESRDENHSEVIKKGGDKFIEWPQ